MKENLVRRSIDYGKLASSPCGGKYGTTKINFFLFFKNIKLNLMSSKAWSLYMWEANMLITGSIRKLQRQSFDSSQTWNQR